MKTHKKHIIALDVILLIVILMNFTTIFATNFIAVKGKPTIQISEINPVVAEVVDYEVHPESSTLARHLMFNSLWWAVLLSIYTHSRRNVYTEEGLLVLYIMVGFLSFLIGHTFFNDMGFLVGRLFG